MNYTTKKIQEEVGVLQGDKRVILTPVEDVMNPHAPKFAEVLSINLIDSKIASLENQISVLQEKRAKVLLALSSDE